MPVEELLRVGQTARRLDVSPSYVRVLTDAGNLPLAATAGGWRLYRQSDVERLAEERRARTRPAPPDKAA